jgi:hypothetical protein
VSAKRDARDPGRGQSACENENGQNPHQLSQLTDNIMFFFEQFSKVLRQDVDYILEYVVVRFLKGL